MHIFFSDVAVAVIVVSVRPIRAPLRSYVIGVEGIPSAVVSFPPREVSIFSAPSCSSSSSAEHFDVFNWQEALAGYKDDEYD